MSDESIGYSEAVAELEQILEQLERPDVDVDVLARQVQRVCRAHPDVPGPHRSGTDRGRDGRHPARRLGRHRLALGSLR